MPRRQRRRCPPATGERCAPEPEEKGATFVSTGPRTRVAARLRAARVTGAGLTLCDLAEPEGDFPVYDVVAASICGTDFELVARGMQGFTLGHEMSVTADGAVYAVEPTVRCGECEQCRAGFTQRCTGEHGNLGIFSDGGLAQRVAVPSYALVPLPPGLDPLDACLVEPAAVAWHGVRRADVGSSERVAVVGGGSIGLLVAAWLRSLGHSVDLEARHPHQGAIARDLGAGSTEDLYDVVIDAAGGTSSLGRCAELAIPGGRIIVLGVYFDSLPVPGALMLTKELTCVAAMAYGAHAGVREFEEAARLLADHPEVPRSLVTHRFPLSEITEAFRVADDRASGAVKVVITP